MRMILFYFFAFQYFFTVKLGYFLNEFENIPRLFNGVLFLVGVFYAIYVSF